MTLSLLNHQPHSLSSVLTTPHLLSFSPYHHSLSPSAHLLAATTTTRAQNQHYHSPTPPLSKPNPPHHLPLSLSLPTLTSPSLSPHHHPPPPRGHRHHTIKPRVHLLRPAIASPPMNQRTPPPNRESYLSLSSPPLTSTFSPHRCHLASPRTDLLYVGLD